MVISRGTGTKDFGSEVYTSTVPVTRTHQYRTVGAALYDLTPYSAYTIADVAITDAIGISTDFSALVSSANVIHYSSKVSLDANVLIKAIFCLLDYDTGLVTEVFNAKYGYGSVEFVFPKGFFVSKTDIKNYIYPTIMFLPGGYKTRVTQTFVTDIIA